MNINAYKETCIANTMSINIGKGYLAVTATNQPEEEGDKQAAEEEDGMSAAPEKEGCMCAAQEEDETCAEVKNYAASQVGLLAYGSMHAYTHHQT